MTGATAAGRVLPRTGEAVAALRRAWALNFPSHDGAKILLADEAVLAGTGSATASSYSDFLTAVRKKTLQKPLHTALLPQPFIGNPESAKIILLMLNPGLGPMDYYAELSANHDSSYIEALRSNLRGDTVDFPFFFLNPSFCWHPGAEYWHRRLGWLIDAFIARGLTPEASRHRVAQNVCCIQSLPYHSTDSSGLRPLLKKLPSVTLARDAATELAADPTRLTIIMRNVDLWQLAEANNVKYAAASHRRSATIPADSVHGKAILQWLE